VVPIPQKIVAYFAVPISASVVGLTFLLAFSQNIRMIILLWLDILFTWLLLWFPTASVNHYVKNLEERLEQMKKDKTVRGEANYQRRRPGRQGGQNPVGGDQTASEQAAPANMRTAAGSSPPPPTDVREEDDLANGAVTSRASTRSKVPDEEVAWAASAPAAAT
jgi:hypothetical protein